MKIYDTSSLLLLNKEKLAQEKFLISSITLEELESIKTSSNKDNEIKYQARKILRLLDSKEINYECFILTNDILQKYDYLNLILNNDAKILITALEAQKKYEDLIFVTNDLALKIIAQAYFHKVDSVNNDIKEDEYTGYADWTCNDELMTEFYSNPNENIFNLLPNQYLIIRNTNREIVDKLCWTGSEYRHLSYDTFSSVWFGDVKPLKDDPYQTFAADSLMHNQITMICGRPGSGKTYLALSYLFNQLQKGKIERIVIFCNPVVARDAAKLGFYPGTVIEKLMSTQAGNVLSSKLGDSLEVEHLIQQGKLVLIPAGDARGYETPPNSGVYIMESQNLTDNLLRMLLQRIGEDSKVIVDGDYNEQVDMEVYKERNGMRIMSQAFRGESLFGQIELKQIHRSKIAQIADRMMN